MEESKLWWGHFKKKKKLWWGEKVNKKIDRGSVSPKEEREDAKRRAFGKLKKERNKCGLTLIRSGHDFGRWETEREMRKN